jgi:hypothetical protein
MSMDQTSLVKHQQDTQTAIAKHGLPTVEIAQGRLFYRVQSSSFANPLFYNRDSPTRYGDIYKQLGVCYVAGSDLVAVAETLQVDQAFARSPLTRAVIESKTLHTLATSRTLRVVDVAVLARTGGKTLDALVGAPGEGGKGYAYTQMLSALVMRHPNRVDGLLYPSRAYAIAGSIRGCNLALFEGRANQLMAVNRVRLIETELGCGESIMEFLLRIQVPFG